MFSITQSGFTLQNSEILRKMDASVPRFLPDPARSPEDTLLERILSHGFAEGGADCPQLRALAGRYAFDRAPAGAVRNETLRHGLDALNALGCARVVILDAVRPLVTPELLDEYLRLIGEGWDAVSTVQPITDSLGCLDAHEVDRSRYYLMQSPEAYNFPLLYAHFRPDSPLTEVAHQLPADSRLYLYRDFPENPKLTYPWEKAQIAQALKARRAK